MKTHFLKYLGIIGIIALFSCSSEEEVFPEQENIDDPDRITLFLADKGITIELNDINDVKKHLKDHYPEHTDLIQKSIKKVNVFQEEVTYAQTLDLSIPKTAKQYEERLRNKYSTDSRVTPGVLWDGSSSSSTGFISYTNIPTNLRKHKRNRASSWTPYSTGLVILCDKNWFRGDKFVLVSVIPGPTPVVISPFNNRTNSFF